MGTSPVPNAKPWAPGVSGNPAGRPKIPTELRLARRKNMANLITLVHQYIVLSDEQAKQRIDGPDAQLIEEMIYGQINRAKEGDSKCFQFIIEIMCGKIPEADDGPDPQEFTPEQKIEIMTKGIDMLKEEIGRRDGSGVRVDPQPTEST